MLHEPSQQFANQPRPSRVAVLASEYARWFALYQQSSDAEEEAEDRNASKDELDRFHTATKQAVRRMHECIDELMITPARTLHDFGMKARIVKEFQDGAWYCDNDKLDRGEKLARAMMVELLVINDIEPLEIRDFKPSQILAEFREPATPVLPLHPRATQIQASSVCSVGEMGRNFKEALERFNSLDACRSPDPRDQHKLDAACTTAALTMHSLSDGAPFVQAASAEGALFQVILACGAADACFDMMDQKDQNYAGAEAYARRAQAALVSVRRFLEAQFGIDGKNLGSNYWMNEDHTFQKQAADAVETFGRPSFLEAAE